MNESLLTKVIAIAESYSEAVGVECRVLGRDGSFVWPAGDPAVASGCSFCRLVRSLDPSHVVECGNIHRYGVYQAERFGGKYIYFCSSSLLHWAVPVTSFGETVAALIGGPVLLVEPEEILSEELGTRYGFSGTVLESVEKALRDIRLVPPSQATAFTEVLYGLASGISANAIPDAVQAGLDEEGLSGGPDEDSIPPFEFGRAYADYPLQKEKDLLACVSKGDQEGARVLMNDLLGHLFFSSGKRMDVVRSRLQELAVLLSRAALEGGASEEEVFGLNNVYLKQIQTVRSFEDMAFLLAKIMRRFSDCVFDLQAVKHADVMHKALRYFNEHYAEKISLETTAAHVHLSPSYFSRLFKDEMKTNFSTYLNELRIEKSKRLLADRGITLVDVAGRAGFDDQSYFTKVFKKVAGTSPGTYRESRGSAKAPAAKAPKGE